MAANEQDVVLEVESRFYENNRAEFVEKYPNEYLLIHGERLIGHFEDMDEALDEGVRRFGSGPFLVRMSGADEPELAAHLFMLAR